MEVRVVKYGRGMNSRKPERRNLYVEIQPDDLADAKGALINLVNTWKFDTPSLDVWYTVIPCKACVRRVSYEHEKFIKGEWVWNRRFCMRHYLIEHLFKISGYDELIESNRYVELSVSKERIFLGTRTVNYDYSIAIDRRSAIMSVVYKGRTYTFRYNNHLNALPLASSYLNLLETVTHDYAKKLYELLDNIYWKMEEGRCAAFNVFVNGKLVVPACSD
jgi:hypothetical protein